MTFHQKKQIKQNKKRQTQLRGVKGVLKNEIKLHIEQIVFEWSKDLYEPSLFDI